MRPYSMLLMLGTCLIGAVGCSTSSRSSSQLAQLLATNAPCHVRLDPSWLGTAVYTVRTGVFTNADPESARLDLDLRFDWFRFSDKTSYFPLGPTVCRSDDDGSESAFHTWRASFPSDGDLMAASTVSSLEKLLGPSQSPSDKWGFVGEIHSSAGWSFFSLANPDDIETLSIFCDATQRKGDTERRVDSLRITRGRATAKRPGAHESSMRGNGNHF